MSHVCIISMHFVWYIYGLRGASALLVSTCKAFLGASEREAGDSAGLHAFFMS